MILRNNHFERTSPLKNIKKNYYLSKRKQKNLFCGIKELEFVYVRSKLTHFFICYLCLTQLNSIFEIH